jgi:hypothetical protein
MIGTQSVKVLATDPMTVPNYNVPCPSRVLCHEYRRSKRRCVTVREMKEGQKKERSGVQSACDELIDKSATSQANSGLYASGAGRVHPVVVGWSTRNRPLLPGAHQ